MKRADRAQIKHTGIPAAVLRKANAKIGAENMARPPTKSGQHGDLKEQNRLLIQTNEDLQRQTSEIKEYVAVLEQRCKEFQEENIAMKEKLRDCHALLIAEKLDPVSGERIGETADQMDGQRKGLMTISQNLLAELKSFDEAASEHRAHLTDVHTTMKSLKEARETLCLNMESFCDDAEEMERTLEEAERLLRE